MSIKDLIGTSATELKLHSPEPPRDRELPTMNNIAALAISVLDLAARISNCERNDLLFSNSFNEDRRNFQKGVMELVSRIEGLEARVKEHDLLLVSRNKFSEHN